jgi:V8-like Glu-specific endopeptidase
MPSSRFRRRAARAAVLSFAVAGTLAAMVLVPADGSATGSTQASWLPGGLDRAADSAAQGRAGQAFDGVAAVGALFTEASGRLGQHFCTASVVHSTAGDLALTAAHCVTGRPGTMVFVPGYSSGREPFGVWQITGVYADRAWAAGQDPDHDIAFLRLARAANGVSIENVTGAEQLSTTRPPGSRVRVIGYPDAADQPVWCDNEAKSFTSTQLEFDCGGYTIGTSGGPFLANVDDASGQGTVIGVIGGYQQGGDTADVSYSVAFGAAVAALFLTAQSDGWPRGTTHRS